MRAARSLEVGGNVIYFAVFASCYSFPHVFRQVATDISKDEFLAIFPHPPLPPRSVPLRAIQLADGEFEQPSPSEPIERRCRRVRELLVHVWRRRLGAATGFSKRIYHSM